MARFSRRQSNPFYLLSAVCMLLGCLLITNPWTYIPSSRDLLLLLTLNIYEAALIALAWYLIRRRGLIHDGVMLIAVEAFFLCDATFLCAQVITGDFALALSIVLFIATIVKLLCVVTIAGLPLREGKFAAMAVQLAALLAIPFIFRHFDDGDLPTRLIYAAWWTAGLLIPACFMMSRARSGAPSLPWMNGIARLLCVLPWLSLVMHLGILHYVYRVTFYGAELAPVLLGLACLTYHIKPSRLVSRGDLIILQIVMPLIAIGISLTNPGALFFAIGRHGRLNISPAELGIAGAYLTYIYCFARRYAAQFLAAAALAVLTLIFGPTTQQIMEGGWQTWTWVSGTVWSVLPKTAIGAGTTAIAAAFAFLGLGAAVSLRRREHPEQTGDPLGN